VVLRQYNLPGTPSAVPTLDELAADPERAMTLSAAALQGLLCRCVTVQTAVLGALVAASGRTTEVATAAAQDTLLDIAEAAKRLATTKDWLYRHAHHLPFTVRNGRQLRFSRLSLERYIREHSGLPYRER
jgi:excisionase family DNA binding protein